MNSNTNVKRLVQVSEESAPIVQVPVIVGNEYYIITQQDVRRIEDTRYLSYCKLGPNGQLLPVAVPGGDSYQYQNALGAAAVTPQSVGIDFTNIEEIVKKILNKYIDVEESDDKESDDDEECSKTVATLTDQLKWSKSVNTPKTCATTYTEATSTTDLHAQKRCKCCQTYDTCSRGNNTMNDEDLPEIAVKQTDSRDLCASEQKRTLKKTRFACE